MDPLDLPPFDVLAATFDDVEDLIPLEDVEDTGIYEPLPINYYNTKEDHENFVLSNSSSSILKSITTPTTIAKVPPPCFLEATSFSAQESEMSLYTESLSKVEPKADKATKVRKAVTASKVTLKSKKQTRKTKARPDIVIEGLEKPKKPLGSYSIFQQHERVKLLASIDVDFDYMDTIISLKWKQATQDVKDYYQELAVHEKVAYETAMVQYRKKRRSLLKKRSAAAKAQTNTSASLTPELVLVTPNASQGDLSSQGESFVMNHLASKLGDEATQAFIKMFV